MNKPTSIEHIIMCNNATTQMKTRNVTTESDHDLILMKVKINGEVTWQESNLRRNYKKCDKDDYLMELLSQR